MVLFLIFIIIAIWYLPLPLWIQICLTVFGTIAIIDYADECERIKKLFIKKEEN